MCAAEPVISFHVLVYVSSRALSAPLCLFLCLMNVTAVRCMLSMAVTNTTACLSAIAGRENQKQEDRKSVV